LKIGIVAQYEKTAPRWFNHPELYVNDRRQVFDISKALQINSREIQTWGNLGDLCDLITKNELNVDILWNLSENCFERNSNGIFPGFLEMHNVPYIGNDLFANTVCANKCFVKDICKILKIPTPNHILIHDSADIYAKIQVAHLKFPIVVKLAFGTMSHLCTKANDLQELVQTINLISSDNGTGILCEEYISGHEITVPIIGSGQDTRILSVITYTDNSIQPLELYDSKWKTQFDAFIQLHMLDASQSVTKQIMKYSLQIYNYLGLRDFGRIDFRLDEGNSPYLLEVNSVPTLSLGGAFDPISYGGEMTYSEVLEEIMRTAIRRYE
jgi:D-alanine-D-alanine ligase